MNRLRRWALPSALATIALVIAGCGTTTRTVTVTRTPVQVTKQIATICGPQDYAAECVLPSLVVQPFTLRASNLTAPSLLQGIDFAWTKFGPTQVGSFGASYLSTDPSKNWNRALVRAYHAAGKGTVAVWETSATRATAGCAAGASDARAAEAQLALLGFPRSHFNMAIDFDATGPQIASYFLCANQAEPGLVGAYGGYRPLAYLCANHITTLNWQTYAWSGGLWLPASCAPLEQYLNGSSFDHDRAIALDYGQFPTPAAPGPSAATIANWRGARNTSFSVYHRKGCTNGLDRGCRVLAQRVTYFQGRLWSVYSKWSCFGRRAHTHSAVCWIVRPEVSRWSKERASTQRAYDRDGCNGIASFGLPVNSRHCRTLRQRRAYFNARVTLTVKAYS